MTNLELAEAAVPTAQPSQHHHELEAPATIAHSQRPTTPQASPSSPDPMLATDRYRLVTPYLLKL